MANSKHAQARAQADIGLRIVPTCPGEGCPWGERCPGLREPKSLGKHPLLGKGWQSQATTRPPIIDGWWRRWPDANIGYVTDGLVVVDFDWRNDADESIKRLHQEQVVFSDTRVERSGNGGHLVYRQPPGTPLRNGKLAPGVDVKANGGLVVGVGSRHPNGETYELLVDAPIAEVPAWVVERLVGGEGSDASRVPDGWPGLLTVPYPGRQRGIRTKLLEMRREDPGEDRSGQTNRLTNTAVEDGLSDAWAMWLALGHRPTRQKYGDRWRAEVQRIVVKHRQLHPHEGQDCITASCPRPPEWMKAREARRTAHDEEFWDQRELLDHVRRYARARRVPPWAVFGAVLANISAATPTVVVLPPLIGVEAPINMFVALVGPPGAGKGASAGVAREAVVIVEPFDTAGIGTGEGLVKLYKRHIPKDNQVEDLRDAVLLDIPEIGTLTALRDRKGTTIASELQKAWAGETLGFANSDPSKAMHVARMSYRLAVTMGVQPSMARSLLQTIGSGLPQRFLWLPVRDPGRPDERPSAPGLWRWRTPPWSDLARCVLEVCPKAQADVDADIARRLADWVDDAEGHTMQVRLRVAAEFAILDGRLAVEDEDWELAGYVMARSAGTLSDIASVLREETAEYDRQRAEREGHRELVRAATIAKGDDERVAANILRRLQREGTKVGYRQLRKKAVNSRDVKHYDGALQLLEEGGRIESEPSSSGDGVVYWAV